MIWLVFASMSGAVAIFQAPYASREATPEIYQAPEIRPFEPPSDFGREPSQGDNGDTPAYRAPLGGPVTVDAYAGQYEVSPGAAETAYDQGVAQAEIDTDRRMGPLDGRWRVAGTDGRLLMSLALTDRGEGRRIEGAWRRLDTRAETPVQGPAGPATADGEGVVIPAAGGELRLHPAGGGWSGELVVDGRSLAVIMDRAG